MFNALIHDLNVGAIAFTTFFTKSTLSSSYFYSSGCAVTGNGEWESI
ncbi:hypothetical protein ABN584_14335 [Gloeocapsa sp. BRSZ]